MPTGRSKRLAVFTIALSLLLAPFQNCSQSTFKSAMSTGVESMSSVRPDPSDPPPDIPDPISNPDPNAKPVNVKRYTGDPVARFRSVQGPICVANAAKSLVLANCTDTSSSMNFAIHIDAEGNYELANNGLCLTVMSATTAGLMACTALKNQKFDIRPNYRDTIVSGQTKKSFLGNFQIRSVLAPVCLFSQNGKSLILKPCEPSPVSDEQSFSLSYVEDAAQKHIYAHVVPVFALDTTRLTKELGAMYPLAIQTPAENTLLNPHLLEMKSALFHGINAFAIDTLPDMKNARNYVILADQVPGFRIIPTLDCAIARSAVRTGKSASIVDWTVSSIKDYVEVAKAGRISPVKVGNKYVISTYSQGGVIQNSDWRAARALLAREGIEIYVIGDTTANYNGNPTPTAFENKLSLYIDDFDMGYAFLGVTPAYEASYLRVFNQHQRPFAGGIMPAYYRGYGAPWPYGPFGFDGYGTAVYRQAFARQTQMKLPALAISTWNDYVEHTNVNMSTEWMTTRLEIAQWYAALYRGAALPFQDVRVYVTAPQALRLGQSGTAEALVINPSDKAVTVDLIIRDPQNRIVSSARKTIAARSLDAASLVLNFSDSKYKFVVPTATSGNISVNGMPVLIYPEPRPADFHSKPVYASVPSTRYFKVAPQDIELAIDEGRGTMTFNVPENLKIKFADVLHDTNKFKTLVRPTGLQSINLNAPASGGTVTDADYYILHYQSDHGAYVLRLIDESNRVVYLSPQFYLRR